MKTDQKQRKLQEMEEELEDWEEALESSINSLEAQKEKVEYEPQRLDEFSRAVTKNRAILDRKRKEFEKICFQKPIFVK